MWRTPCCPCSKKMCPCDSSAAFPWPARRPRMQLPGSWVVCTLPPQSGTCRSLRSRPWPPVRMASTRWTLRSPRCWACCRRLQGIRRTSSKARARQSCSRQSTHRAPSCSPCRILLSRTSLLPLGRVQASPCKPSARRAPLHFMRPPMPEAPGESSGRASLPRRTGCPGSWIAMSGRGPSPMRACWLLSPANLCRPLQRVLQA
mmetsp:Transcript_126200/g.403916  ORF Transcript_126200/g.403916 Transcript_126200/m.403916 type:complete len:203 (+) Transcript_126200:1487-2095(+)